MKRINNNKKFKITLAVLLLVISIGYALLNANLNINGTSNFARTTWNIHFENLTDNTNMTLGQNDSAAAITQNKTNEVTYAVSFTEPGQFYEFTVDAKNDGTIDGMVNQVTSTIKIGNGEATPITTSPSNLPAYMSYTATYSDGTPIEQYHLLAANTKETYKVRIEFKTDIEATDLPGTDETIELTFGVEYVQKDANAVPSHIIRNEGYVVSSNLIINQRIPNGAIIRNTPELAMLDWETEFGEPGATRPFYLKIISNENDEVIEAYTNFLVTTEMAANNPGMTSGTYSLRGGIDERNESEKPIYEANANIVKEVFDYENYPQRCYESESVYESSLDCSVNNLEVIISSNGYTCVYDLNNSGYCDIDNVGNLYCSTDGFS